MYVYLIQAGDKKTSPVKVGYSKNPEDRLKSLQTGNPVPLRLIMKIKCNDEKHARRLERSLHEMLGTQNLFLEWFTLKGTHITKMLNAFANDENFDQVEHCENLQHYSRMPGSNKSAKKYRGLRKHLKQMEASAVRKNKEASLMRKYIHEHTGMCSMEVKRMITDQLGPRIDVSDLEFTDEELNPH